MKKELNIKINYDFNNMSPDELDRYFDNIPPEDKIDYEFSDRFKINMNRFFREYVATQNIPYVELDNIYEKTRSNLILALKKTLIRIKKLL